MVNDKPMMEVWWGFYKYVYNLFDPNVNYAWLANPNSASAYIISGVTQLPGWARWGSGIWWVSLERVNTLEGSISKKLTQLYEKLIEEKPKKEDKEIDFSPILDKIDSIEIPENKIEEKEAKKALKLIENLDKKLSGYIDKEISEKDELSAITREFTKLEMEHNEKKMKHEEEKRQKELEEKRKEEEDKKKEEESDKEELILIQAEFDKLAEEKKIEKKKEIEMELKEIEKERKELEKELKSL